MGLTPFSGAADIFLAPVNMAGELQGDWFDPGNTVTMSLKSSGSPIYVKSRQKSTMNQVVGVKAGEKDQAGTIVFKGFDAKNLAHGLSGNAVPLTVTSGTETDKVITAPVPGYYVELGREDVSDVVVQDETDTTTYVKGTDYNYNPALGLFTILTGGGISEDDTLHIDFAYAAQSGYQVNIGTEDQILMAIKGDVYNEFSGESWKLNLKVVSLVANSEIPFISEAGSEGETIDMVMTPITPEDGSGSAGYVRLQS